MSTIIEEFATSYNKWLRLVIAIDYAGKDLCKSILHDYEGYPKDEKELFQKLLPHKDIFKKKLEKQIITQADYDKIYPENEKTSSNHFQISLFTIILEVLFNDQYKNTCTPLKKKIDEIFLERNVQFTEELFDEKWNEMIKFLSKYNFNVSLIKDLKTCSLEGTSQYKEEIICTKNELKKFQDLVCDNVWKVMYENQLFSLKDWKQLAKRLDVKYRITPIRKILGTNKMNIKTINKCLQQAKIAWKELKQSLRSMEKHDMVTELQKNTNLTKGLDMLIKQHKDRVSKETKRKIDHQQYVDLVVADSQVIDKRWREDLDEKEFHRMKFTIPKPHFKKITMENLVSNSENITIINGIPGIGKTTLCEEIKYQWSNDNLWNKKIDLLLTISCRIMNIYNFSSTTDLIKHLLPDLQDVELLSEISDRVLLLLDGADEFQNIEELSANPTQSNLKFFKHVIDQPKQELFSKLIISSRPKIAGLLRRFYSRSLSCAVQAVEVCGFNDENIKSFVQKKFQDEAVVETVIRKVHETNTMKAMCSVPIFLKSFCTVYKEDSEIKTPSTMTELLLYTLLTFFKELYKVNGDQQKSEMSLEQLSTDGEVLKHIKNLSKLSEKTLAERKVIFFEEDFDADILNELGKVGFLSKRRHEVKGYAHEYKHLIFQECTAALHILSIGPESKREHYGNPNFRDTLPLVSGLEGILNQSDVPKYLKALVENVTGFEFVESPHVKSFIEEQLIENLDDASLFFNTYVSAQSEFREVPPKKLVGVVTQKLNFKLFGRTIETSQLINFMSFLSPHVEFFKQVELEIHSLDDVQKLVDISRKAKRLVIYTDKGEKWMEYFETLIQPSEDFCVEQLEIFGSLKPVEIILENFRFLCDIKRMEMSGSESGCTLFFLEILEKLFSSGKQMKLQNLEVKIRNDEELHGIGRLFKYVPSIHIRNHCNEIIHQYMNKKNKLKVLMFEYFPALSLSDIVSLEEVIVLDFPMAKYEHMSNQLKKVKNEEERILKVVKIIKIPNSRQIVHFINSVNFVSNVFESYHDKDNIDITIEI